MKTADVKFLVREVLNTLPTPYTEHVNYRDELVMLVMEGCLRKRRSKWS